MVTSLRKKALEEPAMTIESSIDPEDIYIANALRQRYGTSDVIPTINTLRKDLNMEEVPMYPAQGVDLEDMKGSNAVAMYRPTTNQIFYDQNRDKKQQISDVAHEFIHALDEKKNPLRSYLTGEVYNSQRPDGNIFDRITDKIVELTGNKDPKVQHFVNGYGDQGEVVADTLTAQNYLENPEIYSLLSGGNPLKSVPPRNAIANAPGAEDVVPYSSQPLRLGVKKDTLEDSMLRRILALDY